MKLGPVLRQTALGGVLALLIASGLCCGRGEPLSGSGTVKTTGTPTLPVIHTAGGSAMVLIPSGTLLMGDRSGHPNEAPAHEVKVADFSMDVHEVTQADFARYDLPNPSHFKGPQLPVEQVTWPQAALFCNARSRAEGLEPCYNEDTAECNFSANGYRLPTEAEWEYACRVGSKTTYSFGADERQLGRFAWFKDNANKKTHPVGEKQPNAWGLYDMHGNVSEWCNDIYDESYYEKSPSENPTGPAEGKQYVLRGGSWASSADAIRSAYRMGEDSGFSDACLARDAIGFRCVRKSPGPSGAR
jgi:formylglycine-generating enzyme required for sulfatase activity